jgi:hypothetical protein
LASFLDMLANKISLHVSAKRIVNPSPAELRQIAVTKVREFQKGQKQPYAGMCLHFLKV